MPVEAWFDVTNGKRTYYGVALKSMGDMIYLEFGSEKIRIQLVGVHINADWEDKERFNKERS